MSTDDINKLKKKRETLRTTVNKSLRDLEDEISKSDESNISNLEELVEILTENYNALSLVDSNLEKLFKMKDFETEFIESEEYREKVVRGKFRATKKINELRKILSPVTDVTSNLNSSGNMSTEIPNNRNGNDVVRIKLPKITLEKYYGDINHWLTFWNSFESAIHNNDSLDNVEKFYYLRAHLAGTALSTIQGLQITNSNYNTAITLLKSRYAKNDVLIHTHLSNILNIKPLNNSHDAYAFRKFYDKISVDLRSLENLGESLEKLSSVLCTTILKALPKDILIQIDDKVYSDVNKLLSFIEQHLNSLERANLIKNSFPPHEKRETDASTSKLTTKNRISTASGLFNDSNERKTNCILCGNDKHSLLNCNDFKVKDLNEKKNILMKQGCCFICFQKGHLALRCRSNIKCRKCFRRHYDIMCPDKVSVKQTENESSVLSNETCNNEVLMQTLSLKLKNKNKEITIRALIDCGSQKSYVVKNVINKLGYTPIGQEKLNHSLFGGIQKAHHHKRYRIYISSRDERYSCNFEVFDQEQICAEIPKVKDGPWIKEAARQGIYFSDYERNRGSYRKNKSSEIQLLIGADIYGKLLTGKMKFLRSGLVAIETRLGWTIMGKTNEFQKNDSTNIVLSLHVAEAKISDLWRLDTLGILDPGERGSRRELETAAEDHFNRNIKVTDEGRYEVCLPWVAGHPPLPTNRNVAERRLKSCVGSLKKFDRLEGYEAVFKEWLEEGVIEEISPYRKTENEHFLPHRAVVKENSTTKIRPVFDGSARENNSPSINDCLEKGPNLVELIPSVINRFRLHKIGVISDIRRAFLQIQLSEKDRSFLKFLWWEKGDSTKLKFYQHNRVVFGLTCSPYLLGATLQYHLKQAPESMKETATKLAESFYVDNCVTSVEDENKLEKFITESKFILSTAKFDLRGWEHNVPGVRPLNIMPSTNKSVPVLGLTWELNTDCLAIDLREIETNNEVLTKRKILSAVHKVFDPIGYSCPVTLRPKILLQDCWKQKITWDAELPEPISKRFKKWQNQLHNLKDIKIPRCLIENPDSLKNLSLHVFCDASKVAYATCVFLRSVSERSVSCQLVQARSRVAPLKSITIPRLELLACTIGARLAHSIKTDLKLEDLPTHYWSDSGNALFWIKKNENWAPFVFNRVQEIRFLSKPEEWNHIPGVLNCADLPSRGCSAEYLKTSRWWEGPTWLKEPPEFWPKNSIDPDFEVVNAERKKTVVVTSINIPIQQIAFYEKSNSYTKIVRVTAWIYRFLKNLKTPKNSRNSENYLSAEEIKKAEFSVFKYVQKRCLFSENKPCYATLPTMTDEQDLIRVKTKVALREDLKPFRYPIVLPYDHNVTRCLILDKHEELNHAGVQIVMSVLREEFWIVRCRRTVRQVINKCLKCRRFTAHSIEVTGAPLPEDRVREAAIFEVVGIDLCGPLFLKDGSKSWIVLFTCAIFRAVHLELVTSLSTENFLLAFRRFVARRGRPTTVISDNGTNLRKAASELKAIDFDKIRDFANSKKISWKFNPPSAPWWGGFFERMIGMLKAILRRVLGKANLCYEEVNTILCDAESVINSRPLTYVSEDLEDLTPLTPSMFLQEVRETGVADLDLIDATKMRKRFAYRQKVREHLRKRFRIEYLGQLRNFSKFRKETDLNEGDIVLIGDDNTKRLNWPLGKIEALYPGRDGKTRVVRVKTQTGSFLRPVQRLYQLEIHDKSSNLDLGNNFSVPTLGKTRTGEMPSPTSSSGRILKKPQT